MTRFRWWYPVLVAPTRRWGYLAPLVALRYRNDIGPAYPPLPFGWRWFPCPDRCAAYRVPVWLYWLIFAWYYRWWALEPFVRWGWLTIPEGGYWHEARPWFWNAEREAGWHWVRTGEWS